jgi:hypothetical protein
LIYVYGNPRSVGLRMLGAALKEEAPNLRVGGGRELDRATPGALIVCWGKNLQTTGWVLNPRGPKGNKWQELNLLRADGVCIPNFVLGPGRKPNGWYARLFHHHSANDLRRNLTRGDYYTEHVDCTKEYRVHVLLGQTRTGLKVPKEGANVHPVFRTHSCGWEFRYGRESRGPLPVGLIEEARRAVAAVGYDFGAVDIGVKADGSPVVFEVNSAPTLAPATANWYARLLANHFQERRTRNNG